MTYNEAKSELFRDVLIGITLKYTNTFLSTSLHQLLFCQIRRIPGSIMTPSRQALGTSTRFANEAEKATFLQRRLTWVSKGRMWHRLCSSVGWNGKTGKERKKEVSSRATVPLATVAQSYGQKLILWPNTIQPRESGGCVAERKENTGWTWM